MAAKWLVASARGWIFVRGCGMMVQQFLRVKPLVILPGAGGLRPPLPLEPLAVELD